MAVGSDSVAQGYIDKSESLLKEKAQSVSLPAAKKRKIDFGNDLNINNNDKNVNNNNNNPGFIFSGTFIGCTIQLPQNK